MPVRKQDARDYHALPTPGKVSMLPTKPFRTQLDLSLAYTPGVAEACMEIARDPELVWKYTSRSNLFALVTNGSAVLGLGNIGPAAGKPVMEGKALLARRREARRPSRCSDGCACRCRCHSKGASA